MSEISAREKEQMTVELAARIPDAKGLEEIKDPFVKAAVADALDIGKDPVTMRELGEALALTAPRAAARVFKRAEDLERGGRTGGVVIGAAASPILSVAMVEEPLIEVAPAESADADADADVGADGGGGLIVLAPAIDARLDASGAEAMGG